MGAGKITDRSQQRGVAKWVNFILYGGDNPPSVDPGRWRAMKAHIVREYNVEAHSETAQAKADSRA